MSEKFSAKFDAVGFDIDGTVYPNMRFYVRLAPTAILHLPLLLAFRQARKNMHSPDSAPNGGGATGEQKNFYERQAELVASILKVPLERAKSELDKFVYEDWKQHFKNLKTYPHVRETIQNIRLSGCKTGVLSDFPVSEKLKNMDLDGIWDTALCTEEIGALKPSRRGFDKLAEKLGVQNDRMLYVGNSVRFDIAGAKNAGMKAALIQTGPSFKGTGGADFVFHSYRQLERFVLE